MKKQANMCIKNLRYILLIGVITLGLITIIGTGGGGDNNKGNGTCGDQDVGDLSDPGNPAEPTRFTSRLSEDPGPYYVPFPDDFLQYDDVNFDVFQKSMHNRTVTVAIGKNFYLDDEEREEASNIVFDSWAIYWNEFKGFAYPSYTVVMDYDVPYEVNQGTGATAIGFETDLSTPNWRWWVPHENFHAWNNQSIPYNDRKWMGEGITEYYGWRQSGNYVEGMRSEFNHYLSVYKAGRDVSLHSIFIDNPDNLQYSKGSVVVYMLDKELSKTGHHIGEVMKLLYEEYGINFKGFVTTEHFLSVVNKVSGSDFTDFFDKYIYGTEALPLDGSEFEWICHE